jgi:ABC-type amino acid transport substrate-binding protein
MQCYLDNNLPDIDTKVYTAQQDALLDLENGRIDVIIGEGLHLQSNFLDDHPDYAFIGEPLSDSTCFGPGTGIAMQKNDAELKAIVDRGIDAVRADGTFDTLNDKYFNVKLPAGQ